MNMMEEEMIPMVVNVLGAVPRALLKDLEELEIRGRVKTIKTTAELKLARILRRVLEKLLSLHLQTKPICFSVLMVSFNNTMNYLTTQINNETSFETQRKVYYFSRSK